MSRFTGKSREQPDNWNSVVGGLSGAAIGSASTHDQAYVGVIS